MNIFVMVDMEGISGICRSSQVLPADPDYRRGQQYMTWDVNACIEGCFAGGASRVVVRDAHHSGFNLIWDQVDPRAELVQGTSRRERMPKIDTFDGLILLGYHAMAGTTDAILEHTMSSANWQNFWINGLKSGELAIDAAIAGDHSVPTIMTSGDDKLCKEARKFITGIVAVTVKTGIDCQGGCLLSPAEAHKRITAGAAKAVAKRNHIKPYKVKAPVRLRLEKVERGQTPVGRDDIKVINSRTYEVTGSSMWEAFQRL